MKPRGKYFTKTFNRFFIAFLCIIGVAFAVMIGAATLGTSQPPPIVNFAAPR
jgi:hypothetical protein